LRGGRINRRIKRITMGTGMRVSIFTDLSLFDLPAFALDINSIEK